MKFKTFFNEKATASDSAKPKPTTHEQIKKDITTQWDRIKSGGHSKNKPIMIAGVAGIGKTVGVNQAVEEIAKNEEREYTRADLEKDIKKDPKFPSTDYFKESSFYQLTKLLNEEEKTKGKYLVNLPMRVILSGKGNIKVTDESKNPGEEGYELIWSLDDVKQNLANSILYVTVRAAEIPPVAVIGLPTYQKGGETASIAAPGLMASILRAEDGWEDAKGVIFFDEITRILNQDLWNNVMSLVDPAEGTGLPRDKWVIVAAGNTGEMFKGYVTELSDDAISQRFVHYKLEPEPDAWFNYVESKGSIHPDILSYIKDDNYKPFEENGVPASVSTELKKKDKKASQTLVSKEEAWKTNMDPKYHGKFYSYLDPGATADNIDTQRNELQQMRDKFASVKEQQGKAAEMASEDDPDFITSAQEAIDAIPDPLEGTNQWKAISPRNLEQFSARYNEIIGKVRDDRDFSSIVTELRSMQPAGIDIDHPWMKGFLRYLDVQKSIAPGAIIDVERSAEEVDEKINRRLKPQLDDLKNVTTALANEPICPEDPKILFDKLNEISTNVVRDIYISFGEDPENPDAREQADCQVYNDDQQKVIAKKIASVVSDTVKKASENIVKYKKGDTNNQKELLSDLYFLAAYMAILNPQPSTGPDDNSVNMLRTIGNVCSGQDSRKVFKKIQANICSTLTSPATEQPEESPTEQPEGLPDGWASSIDPTTKKTYYFKPGDNESVTWTKPE